MTGTRTPPLMWPALEWSKHAACREIEAEAFFSSEATQLAVAAAACARCPVREECLAHALAVPELFGVWGGMTADQRRDEVRQRVAAMKGTANVR